MQQVCWERMMVGSACKACMPQGVWRITPHPQDSAHWPGVLAWDEWWGVWDKWNSLSCQCILCRHFGRWFPGRPPATKLHCWCGLPSAVASEVAATLHASYMPLYHVCKRRALLQIETHVGVLQLSCLNSMAGHRDSLVCQG